MRYAVLQTTLDLPQVATLQRAFRGVKFLTPMDAHTLGRDAYGILVKNLTVEQAAALQGCLRSEGIETEVVAERSLPVLPATKFVTRLECAPEALMLHDPLGRAFPLEWRHVTLLAAGCVRLSDFERRQIPRRVTRYSLDGFQYQEDEVETRTRERLNDHLVAEILVGRAVARYSLRADEFNFGSLGPRRTDSLPQNFVRLVQDLVEHAPHAALNRGAYYIRENAAELFAYPSKNAFFEELTWLLWQMGRAQGSA
jgi:hypothetical protein